MSFTVTQTITETCVSKQTSKPNPQWSIWINKTIPSTKNAAAFLEENVLNFFCYVSGFASILFVYHCLSDKEFSFLMTLGSLLRTLGFGIVMLKLFRQNSFSGVSLKTFQIYTIVSSCRVFSLLIFEGYQPVDATGEFVIHCSEIFCFLFISRTVSAVLSDGRILYNAAEDSFGDYGMLNGYLGVSTLVLSCMILAIFFHSDLNDNVVGDTIWAFAEYLEVFAVLPQLYMFQKHKKAVDDSVGHLCFLIGFSRVTLLTFWIESYVELGNIVGKLFLGGQLLHIAIMAEFCVYYLVSKWKKKPLYVYTDFV